MINLLKRPAALLPIAMSMTALAVVLGYAAIFGIARQPDEGAAAHIWQLLMAGQVPVLAFFLLRWLPTQPKQVLRVVVIQLAAALGAMLPVWYLRW